MTSDRKDREGKAFLDPASPRGIPSAAGPADKLDHPLLRLAAGDRLLAGDFRAIQRALRPLVFPARLAALSPGQRRTAVEDVLKQVDQVGMSTSEVLALQVPQQPPAIESVRATAARHPRQPDVPIDLCRHHRKSPGKRVNV